VLIRVTGFLWFSGDALIDLALSAGALDNVTVVLARSQFPAAEMNNSELLR